MRTPRYLAASVLLAAGWLGGCGDTFLLSINADGEIHVLIRTDGSDADGWRIRVDGSLERTVPGPGSVTVDSLRQGRHFVELTGVAPGCRVQGANPRSVVVSGATAASVAFDVVCAG
jgi:hypothetical protein